MAFSYRTTQSVHFSLSDWSPIAFLDTCHPTYQNGKGQARQDAFATQLDRGERDMQSIEHRQYVSVREFIEALGGRLSKNSVYQAIAAGTIPSIRIGRRILVPSDALERALEAQASDLR